MSTKQFNGKLGTYKVIETADGTPTLFSSHFDEACHSLHGAVAETLYNFIEGCDLDILAKKYSPLNILEVGFGTGTGFKLTNPFTKLQQRDQNTAWNVLHFVFILIANVQQLCTFFEHGIGDLGGYTLNLNNQYTSSCLVTGQDGVNALRALLTIYESCR